MNQPQGNEMVSGRVTRICGLLCAALGLWGLICWAFNQPLWSSVLPQYVPMSPRSALGFLLVGSALLLCARENPVGLRRFCLVAVALVVVAGAELSLGESLMRFGTNSPANILPTPARFSDYMVIRMSRSSAASLALIGAGLVILSNARWRRWDGVVACIGISVSAVNGIVLLGYLYGSPALYDGTIRPVSLLGALAAVLMGLGLVAATDRRRFPVRLLVGPSVRARLLRFFLPVTFVVVLLNELLSDLVRRYWGGNPALQDALQVVASVLVVTGAIAYVAGKLGHALDQAQAERAKSEQALRQARDELEARVQERTASLAESQSRIAMLAHAVETTAEPICITDLADRFIFVNRAFEATYGYTHGEILGKTPAILVSPANPPHLLQEILRQARLDGWRGEILDRRKDGTEFPVFLSTSQVRDPTGRLMGLMGVAQDITERKRLEKELLEISAKERRRLGHDLHDGLGQYLAGIALKTKLLEDTLAAEKSSQVRRAKEVVGLINSAIRQTRTLAHGLDPVHVEADGVVAALGNLATQTRDLFRLDCSFACEHDRLAVNMETSLALYRITQEAIHNAALHGGARHIEVGLALRDGHVRLAIRDDGNGFSPGVRRGSGMGLHIMQYRARSVGGSLHIDSAPGQGTTITCSIPQDVCLIK